MSSLYSDGTVNTRNLTHPTDGINSGVTRGKKNPLWFGLAARLQKMRAETGLSMDDLSALAGCGNSVIHWIESGKNARIDTVEKIALSLGVPVCWLAFGSDGEEPFRQKIIRGGSGAPDQPSPEPEAAAQATAHLGLSQRLQVARKAAAISMRELSRRAELSVNAISLLENGTGIPRIDNCEALALALDVAPCWLAFGVGRGPALN